MKQFHQMSNLFFMDFCQSSSRLKNVMSSRNSSVFISLHPENMHCKQSFIFVFKNVLDTSRSVRQLLHPYILLVPPNYIDTLL